MNKYKQIIVLLLIAVVSLGSVGILQAETTNYTYTYDYWGIERESPDAYVPGKVLLGTDLGIGSLKEPQGLFATEDMIYIADSGNNRIVQCDEELNLVRVIENFKINGEENTFKYPQDLFVTKQGELYICDTNNQRIVHLDRELNLIKIVEKPTNEIYDQKSEFLPLKIVVDEIGRIYLIAKNVNQGIMEFDVEGNFTGYMGANKVTPNPLDYLWKMIATKEQRAQMELFVPTEYDNLSIDQLGFIYTVTNTISEQGRSVDPIRKLNAMGTDILIRNGYYDPVGDIEYGTAGGVSGGSKFTDIVALPNDIYSAIDRTRGRVFTYDFQGNLLYAFGGIGNKAGYFQYPSAIEHIGDSLLVLDYRTGALTKMDITEYGNLINEALQEYKQGSQQKQRLTLNEFGHIQRSFLFFVHENLRVAVPNAGSDDIPLPRSFAHYVRS